MAAAEFSVAGVGQEVEAGAAPSGQAGGGVGAEVGPSLFLCLSWPLFVGCN